MHFISGQYLQDWQSYDIFRFPGVWSGWCQNFKIAGKHKNKLQMLFMITKIRHYIYIFRHECHVLECDISISLFLTKLYWYTYIVHVHVYVDLFGKVLFIVVISSISSTEY